jgi:Flp pilus assembly protein TadG
MISLMREIRAKRTARHFLRNNKGVAAIEFALLAPLMIAFYFGLVELGFALDANLKVKRSAATVSDIISRERIIDTAGVNAVFDSTKAVMWPLSTNGTNYRIRLVTVNVDGSGVATVGACRSRGLSCPTAGSGVTVPAGIVSNGRPLVKADVEYDYTSSSGFYISSPLMMKSTIWKTPRSGEEIELTS